MSYPLWIWFLVGKLFWQLFSPGVTVFPTYTSQVLLYRILIYLNLLTLCLLKHNRSPEQFQLSRDTFWCGTGSMREHEDKNLDVPWGALGGSCEHIQSILGRSAQDSLEDVCTMDPTPLSPAQPLGWELLQQRGQSPRHRLNHQVSIGVLCKSLCALCARLLPCQVSKGTLHCNFSMSVETFLAWNLVCATLSLVAQTL